MRFLLRFLVVLSVFAFPFRIPGAVLSQVRDSDSLREALRNAQAGARISLLPGQYQGVHFEGLRGEPGKPIVIVAADPLNPPKFTGTGIHLVGCSYVELQDLVVTGVRGNGVNINDSKVGDGSAHHVVLRRLKIIDVGPKGNIDGIKLSGLDDFRIEECQIERWGIGAGSGIDMVGCHRGEIEGNTLRHAADEKASGGNGIQAKGGCRDIVIRRNRFEQAGQRAVNAGGSTGVPYFRPPLEQWPAGEGRYEAKNITIEGNTFIGSLSPIAFVGVDGAIVRYNTIYLPGRWALRILQETKEPGFVLSRNGEFLSNLVVFRTDQWSSGGVNIGAHTAPETFRFEGNHWYCVDQPERSRPNLPTPEKGGVYGRDPLLRDPSAGDMRLREDSPAKNVGATALP